MCGGKGTFFRYEWTGGTDESCPSSAAKRRLGVKTASSSKQASKVQYREIQLDLTPEMEVQSSPLTVSVGTAKKYHCKR